MMAPLSLCFSSRSSVVDVIGYAKGKRFIWIGDVPGVKLGTADFVCQHGTDFNAKWKMSYQKAKVQYNREVQICLVHA